MPSGKFRNRTFVEVYDEDMSKGFPYLKWVRSHWQQAPWLGEFLMWVDAKPGV